MKIFLIILLFGFSHEHFFTDESCPERPAMKNLDLKRFLGEWYVVKVLYNDTPREFHCFHINLTLIDENSFYQVYREMYFGEPLYLYAVCTVVDDGRQFCAESKNREFDATKPLNEIIIGLKNFRLDF